jgi:hypothetical protein
MEGWEMTAKIMWSKTANSNEFVEEEVEIINTPRGEGDMVQVRQIDGNVLYINPYHPWFLGIKIVEQE